jgi:hypothetical protein
VRDAAGDDETVDGDCDGVGAYAVANLLTTSVADGTVRAARWIMAVRSILMSNCDPIATSRCTNSRRD